MADLGSLMSYPESMLAERTAPARSGSREKVNNHHSFSTRDRHSQLKIGDRFPDSMGEGTKPSHRAVETSQPGPQDWFPGNLSTPNFYPSGSAGFPGCLPCLLPWKPRSDVELGCHEELGFWDGETLRIRIRPPCMDQPTKRISVASCRPPACSNTPTCSSDLYTTLPVDGILSESAFLRPPESLNADFITPDGSESTAESVSSFPSDVSQTPFVRQRRISAGERPLLLVRLTPDTQDYSRGGGVVYDVP
ncbi:hypothetical protein Bbelb_098450 [Branchiostoma belcheri]|nr:hypothetical protein Bbelb_098450 [Branchiostoma belcheri]